MSEQVKRSPGRPKKAAADTKPVAKQVSNVESKKTKTIRKKQTSPSHRVYEIKKGGGVVYMFPSHDQPPVSKHNRSSKCVF